MKKLISIIFFVITTIMSYDIVAQTNDFNLKCKGEGPNLEIARFNAYQDLQKKILHQIDSTWFNYVWYYEHYFLYEHNSSFTGDYGEIKLIFGKLDCQRWNYVTIKYLKKSEDIHFKSDQCCVEIEISPECLLDSFKKNDFYTILDDLKKGRK